MLILYAGMKYDYGKPEQGYSFEHYNFYDFLHNSGYDILYFDFITLLQKHGKEWMNRRLREVVESEKPELLFSVLFTDEFEPSVLRYISDSTETVTVNWFCDDHWRFDDFTRHWAPCFNWSITTAKSALPKYERLGYTDVIKSQWGCNHFLYRKLDLPMLYDVSFVGQPHGNRREIIRALQDTGVKVHTWGRGWNTERLAQEEMIRVFNQSRINLNLSNASIAARTFMSRLKKNSRQILPWSVWRHLIEVAQEGEQIKGRNFEVPGCGGFLLTGLPENIEEYYTDGKEITSFTSIRELQRKVKYYLQHEEERNTIRQAGYERTRHQHTYAHRFHDIFSTIGIQGKPLEQMLSPIPRPGQTMEIN